MANDYTIPYKKYKFDNLSFSGTDIVATCQVPKLDGSGSSVYSLGSLQTLTYSIHMDRRPVRAIGNVNAKDYLQGPRTIAGTLVFAVFNKHIFKDLGKELEAKRHSLMDELPPIDITVSFANEYGVTARLAIYGVRLVNEGQVMSINDVYTENTYQFVARDIDYMAGEEEGDIKPGGIVVIAPGDDRPTPDKPNVQPNKTLTAITVRAQLPTSDSSRGRVSISLFPLRDTGVLFIRNKLLVNKPNLVINVAQYPNQTIHVELDPSDYETWYQGATAETSSFNNESFKIEAFKSNTVIQKSSAPIIEKVTTNSIFVYAQDGRYTQVRYYENGGSELALTLENRRAEIKGLKPGTDYSLYVCESSLVNRSVLVKVTTNMFNEYAMINKYLVENKSRSELDSYLEITGHANSQTIDKHPQDSFTDNLIAVKNIYLSDLKKLDPNRDKDAIAALKIKIKKTSELISIMAMISRDSLYGVNTSSSVDQPIIDIITNSIYLTPEVTLIEIYIKDGANYKLDRTVWNNSFTKAADGRVVYKFNDRKQDSKYYVVALNKDHDRSPRAEFYTPTYTEVTEEYNKIMADRRVADSMLASVIKNFKNFNLSEEALKRAAVEYAKVPKINKHHLPIVSDTSNNSITVDFTYIDLPELSGRDFYLVVAPIEEALYSMPRRRVLTSSALERIEFNSRDHGIRYGSTYAFWIEDEYYEQVSRCVTARAVSSDLNSDDNEAIRHALVSLYVDKIKDMLIKRGSPTTLYKTALDDLKTNDYVTLNNVFGTIINNMTEDSKISKLPGFERYKSDIIKIKEELQDREVL